jgi:hypothetical protein
MIVGGMLQRARAEALASVSVRRVRPVDDPVPGVRTWSSYGHPQSGRRSATGTTTPTLFPREFEY